MHRPPDTIPTSGPVRNTRAGLIVPPPPKGSSNSRRHSVVSFSARDVTAFPIRTNESSQKIDARRPSDLWLSKKQSMFPFLTKLYFVEVSNGDSHPWPCLKLVMFLYFDKVLLQFFYLILDKSRHPYCQVTTKAEWWFYMSISLESFLRS
jgi:hypothetical protein